MKRKNLLILSLTLVLGALLVGLNGAVSAQRQEPSGDVVPLATILGTAFTYQGRLNDGGGPANDIYDFEFKLYDTDSDGSQVGSTVTKDDVTVNDGLFIVELDFGSGVFNGDARWLEMGVRPWDSGGAYTALDPRQLLSPVPYALYATQAPWSGLTGVPVGLDDGDDDTTYSAGTGLDLSGAIFSVITTTVQQRVSDACAVGSTIRSINADGTAVCQSDAPLNRSAVPSANTSATLDSAGEVGFWSSLSIGADGLGLISYCDNSNTSLKVAHCDDLVCSSATVTMLDNTGNTGDYPSLSIGADGLGLISYYDEGGTNLRVAHCDDLVCTSATRTTLDSTGTVGTYNSLTIGADGLGLISYYDEGGTNLRVAHCSNITCTSATLTTLDSAGEVGFWSSLSIGADGLGLISYYDSTNSALKVAHCDDLACSSATTTTLDSAGDVGRYSSLTISADGLGLISYYGSTNSALKVAHCNDLACSSAITTTLDSIGGGGQGQSSLTIGPDGLGLISYYFYDGVNGDLRVAHCSDIACSSAITTTLDSVGIVGLNPSLTIGVDGLGLVSYTDGTNWDLKVAHCANTFCLPYFRRR